MPLLTPNFISFVASVNTLLYPATRSLSIIMSDGINIIPGVIAMLSTTFVFFYGKSHVGDGLDGIVLGYGVFYQPVEDFLRLQRLRSV